MLLKLSLEDPTDNCRMHFEVLSLFPQYIQGPLEQSILKRAIENGHIKVTTTDIRGYSQDPFRRVDDRPYGGGPGMVMMADPVVRAIQDKRVSGTKVIYLSPQGRPLTPLLAKELAKEKSLILLAGHYEGIDQRAIDREVDYEVSIGDYVLTNGCLAALVVIDVVSRYIPGVLGDEAAAFHDSFESYLLDFPHYTKPDLYDGVQVDPVLKSGNHAHINEWRQEEAMKATWKKRPDRMAQALFPVVQAENSVPTLLSHIALPVTDLKKTVVFYEKLLGRKADTYLENPNIASWVISSSSDSATTDCFTLSLYQAEKSLKDINSVLFPALRFSVQSDVAASFFRWAFTKEAISENISQLMGHRKSFDSLKKACESVGEISFHDPAGMLITLSIRG